MLRAPMLAETSIPLMLLLIVGGGLATWLGAEMLVRASSRLAAALGMSPFLIGATIIAFGTSAPEWVVSFIAQLDGEGGMSLGNIVGSNICNIALVLGATAMILRIRVAKRTLVHELPLVFFCQLLFFVFGLDGRLALADGILLLGVFVLSYAYLIGLSRRQMREREAPKIEARIWRDTAVTIAGLVILIAGARFFVSGASDLAKHMGMSKETVGLTVIAIGTSLPELVTSVVAALRNQLEISLGNLLGSNLFNALLVGGSLAIVDDVEFARSLWYDCFWMLGVTVAIYPLVMWPMLLKGGDKPHIVRFSGILLLTGYVVYLISTLVRVK